MLGVNDLPSSMTDGFSTREKATVMREARARRSLLGCVAALPAGGGFQRPLDEGGAVHPLGLGGLIGHPQQTLVDGDVDANPLGRHAARRDELDEGAVAVRLRIGRQFGPGAGTGNRIASARRAARWPDRASRAAWTTSSKVSPADTQPGRSGKVTPQEPWSSGG